MAGRISEYLTLSGKITGTELVDVSAVDAGSPTGYSTRKTTVADLADFNPSIYSASSDLAGNRVVDQSSYSLFFNNGDFGIDDGFYFEDLTKRIGIGTQSPTSTLHIKGQSGDDLLKIEDSTGINVLKVENDGKIFLDNNQFLWYNNAGGRFDISDNIRPVFVNAPSLRVSTETVCNLFRSKDVLNTGIKMRSFHLESVAGVTITPQDHHRFDTDGVALNDSFLSSVKNNGVRMFSIMGDGRINASSLPTSSSGLVAGDIWNDAGTLKIV